MPGAGPQLRAMGACQRCRLPGRWTGSRLGSRRRLHTAASQVEALLLLAWRRLRGGRYSWMGAWGFLHSFCSREACAVFTASILCSAHRGIGKGSGRNHEEMWEGSFPSHEAGASGSQLVLSWGDAEVAVTLKGSMNPGGSTRGSNCEVSSSHALTKATHCSTGFTRLC